MAVGACSTKPSSRLPARQARAYAHLPRHAVDQADRPAIAAEIRMIRNAHAQTQTGTIQSDQRHNTFFAHAQIINDSFGDENSPLKYIW